MNHIGANSKTAENQSDITPIDLALQPNYEERLSHIAESAYYKPEARGFFYRYELQD